MNEENQQLSKAERRQAKRERRQTDQQKQLHRQKLSKLLKRVVWLAVIAGILASLSLVISKQKILPPTSSKNHIERSPDSHIVTEPMDLRVHRHMLEHADGSGPPGVIINYNCEQFDCAPDLLENLAKIAQEYPENVYIAPYKNMSAKLVLTREGRQEILDNFDEQKIRDFTNR